MQDSSPSDGELLKSYLEERSESAFAELVQRYVDLVYSTAWRVTGDAQMARDISQEVFLKLANQAASLRSAGALPAWLYRVAQARAVNAVRAERRRATRERQAVFMKEQLTDAEDAWTALRPALDEAVATLDRTEQTAVVLRFFADQKLADVGEALGMTEDAARKRVTRALEKLRRFFSKRGVEVSSSTLATVLGLHAVEAAPLGLAATLTSTALAGGASSAGSGVLFTLSQTLLMSKAVAAAVTVLAVGALVTPLVLKKPRASSPTAPLADRPLLTTTNTSRVLSAAEPAKTPGVPLNPSARSLLERVALLPPLAPQQVGDYVARNHGNAESLLAAWRASGDKAWLAEAASRYSDNPEVQYAVIATRALPEAQRQWIEAYKAASPDNALAWYFSAHEYLRSGDKARALEELAEATRKTGFRAQLAATLQALEELNLTGGRQADEAKVAAFQTCAQSPELPGLRDLAKGMRECVQQYRQQGDFASAESLTGMGLVLGAHLSDGYGSQTIINQLVGMAIQKMFLEMLDPAATRDPFGRPVADLRAGISQRQAALKDAAALLQKLLTRLEDSDWAIYMERVKLYGEEAALAWLKARDG